MSEVAHVSKLHIYPIKALGHIELSEALIGEHSLVNDRVFAMVDKTGRYLNGKRTSQVNLLKTTYDLERGAVTFLDTRTDSATEFELREGNDRLDEYLSDFFSMKLNLKYNVEGQFMDIPIVAALTVVSEASLRSLQKDLGQHSLESLRLRFRSTVEIAGVEAYWEENLYGKPDTDLHFKIGDVNLIGISPRARCSVPPQDPISGEIDRSFMKAMIDSRTKSMPKQSLLSDYGQVPYYLSVNVSLPKSETGKILRLQDEVVI